MDANDPEFEANFTAEVDELNSEDRWKQTLNKIKGKSFGMDMYNLFEKATPSSKDALYSYFLAKKDSKVKPPKMPRVDENVGIDKDDYYQSKRPNWDALRNPNPDVIGNREEFDRQIGALIDYGLSQKE